jgi:hypothetical protein
MVWSRERGEAGGLAAAARDPDRRCRFVVATCPSLGWPIIGEHRFASVKARTAAGVRICVLSPQAGICTHCGGSLDAARPKMA